MTAEVKLRRLAAGDATLQGYLGAGPFRWQSRQLTQGYIQKGTCVRTLRVASPLAGFSHSGPSQIELVRLQIDVLDIDADKARTVAAAVDTFLATVSLCSPAEFDSPPTLAQQYPVFKLGQRQGMEFELGAPVYVEILEYRLFNSTMN